MNENKKNEVVEGVFDAIIHATNKFKNDEGFNTKELYVILDGIRILHHVYRMNGYKMKSHSLMLGGLYMNENKKDEVVEAVFDAIIHATNKFKKDEGFNVKELHVILDGIRILHHVYKINGYKRDFDLITSSIPYLSESQ